MLTLLHCLQQTGLLSVSEHNALQKTCHELKENPIRVLRSLNIVSPEQIQGYLHTFFHIPTLHDGVLATLQKSNKELVPIDIALFYNCFGIKEENDKLFVALEDPSDRGTLNQLKFLLEKPIVGVAATVTQLTHGLTKIYGVGLDDLKLTTPLEKSRGMFAGAACVEPKNIPSENHIQPLNPETIQKTTFLMSVSLTKLALASRKTQAFEIINQIFSPLDICFFLGENGSFEIKAQGETLTSSFTNLQICTHPIHVLLLPVLKKIGKLQDERT